MIIPYNRKRISIDLSSPFSNTPTKPVGKHRYHTMRASANELFEKESGRTNGINFISPLLKYGYRPAVNEYIHNMNSTIPSTKPILLYLPGFDGTFLSPFLQFPELHTIFDVRCMTVEINSKLTYEQLKECVIQYLERECTSDDLQRFNDNETSSSKEGDDNANKKTDSNNLVISLIGTVLKVVPVIAKSSIADLKSVYLAGESFGGILASDVALTLLERNNNNKQKKFCWCYVSTKVQGLL